MGGADVSGELRKTPAVVGRRVSLWVSMRGWYVDRYAATQQRVSPQPSWFSLQCRALPLAVAACTPVEHRNVAVGRTAWHLAHTYNLAQFTSSFRWECYEADSVALEERTS